jgi:hypothetical protein
MACAVKKRHWPKEAAAQAALARIQDLPPDPAHPYMPVGVLRCNCGAYVLTGTPRKPNSRGQSRGHRHLKGRRR